MEPRRAMERKMTDLAHVRTGREERLKHSALVWILLRLKILRSSSYGRTYRVPNLWRIGSGDLPGYASTIPAIFIFISRCRKPDGPRTQPGQDTVAALEGADCIPHRRRPRRLRSSVRSEAKAFPALRVLGMKAGEDPTGDLTATSAMGTFVPRRLRSGLEVCHHRPRTPQQPQPL